MKKKIEKTIKLFFLSKEIYLNLLIKYSNIVNKLSVNLIIFSLEWCWQIFNIALNRTSAEAYCNSLNLNASLPNLDSDQKFIYMKSKYQLTSFNIFWVRIFFILNLFFILEIFCFFFYIFNNFLAIKQEISKKIY